jgi:ankyrin repeat protein
VTEQLNLEQLRKLAKERVRTSRAAGEHVVLAAAQRQLAREHGFASWPQLKRYLERADAEQPFHTDIAYYEDRAAGIASVNEVTVAEGRLDLARRHGFSSWAGLRRHVGALRDGSEPPGPFMRAFIAVEAGDRAALTDILDGYPELPRARGTNGNDLLGIAASGRDLDLVRLLLDRGADPNRGNDYGWTPLHQAGYGNRVELATLMLAAGAKTGLSARGDGGTALVAALFWGHREVVTLLGVEPRNLRVAAGLGRVDLFAELAGTPAAGAHRGFYRPHGGFPAWRPSEDPQEVLDEALVWAAKSDRVEALPALVELGARIDADPYRGTALTWAAANGRTASVHRLIELGADPNARGTFGGPDHGAGVTALHLAAQGGHRATVQVLLELGADATIRDALHDGTAAGWAAFSGHRRLAEMLG